jgi:hypothetical protein
MFAIASTRPVGECGRAYISADRRSPPRRAIGHYVCVRGPLEAQPDEQGWWLASDGRWYPPEASLGVPQGSTTRRIATGWSARRIMLLVGALVGIIVMGLVAFAWRQNADSWHQLRSQASHFQPPPGWTLVGKAQEGSGACFISCDSPRITAVYRTTDPPGDACSSVRRAVEAQVGPAPSDQYDAWCGWRAPIPSGGHVVAGAQLASVLRGPYSPSWTTKFAPTGDGTLVWVVFSSNLA